MLHRFLHSVLTLIPALGVGFACLTPVQAEWRSPHPLTAEQEAPAALLPFPQKVEWEQGAFYSYPNQVECLGCSADAPMLRCVLKDMQEKDGFDFSGKGDVFARTLQLETVSDLPNEGYRLIISSGGVRISASDESGLFYGLQTLRQLARGRKGRLPGCRIEDTPAFGLRGFMHDCGRNFRDIDTLKKEIDAAAQLKMNVFQWHLTDDPGWRIECKCHPVLNDPGKRTRDHEDTYSYDQIRDLMCYAAERNVLVIPELDMPGHSAYFPRCFGFTMHSEQGMAVLEKLIDEFCREIPAELCPIIHIGADEVRIPNAQDFIRRMSKRVMEHGRTPMQWGGAHDLPVGEDCIAQRWGEGARTSNRSMDAGELHSRTVDSSMGYTNLFDPALLVRRHFFMRPCGSGKGDAQRLGGIICTWPDIRVDHKENIPLQSAHWPGICAMAERLWCGGDADGDALPPCLPVDATEATTAYQLFEQRMEAMRKTVLKGHAFPFRPESGMTWKLVGPLDSKKTPAVRKAILAGKTAKLQPTHRARGASLYFRTKSSTGGLGIFPAVRPGVTVWAIADIEAEEAGPHPFMIGFDAPARSSRRCSGVPPQGEWSACRTRIWLNGKPLSNPRHYKAAGKNKYERDTWGTPANESPIDNEEIWWAQEPVEIMLQKGRNRLIIEQPYIGEFQTWGVNFIPWEK